MTEYLNTKLKFYNGKMKTNILNKKATQKEAICICLVAIVLISLYKIKNADDKYYTQIFLEKNQLKNSNF